MNDVQQRAAAKHFAEYWKGKGYERGESQKFWLSLLGEVLGVEHASESILFEDQVHLDHTSFIDGYIPETRVLIEQKSKDKSLRQPIRQSDGSLLTPREQAQRYIHALLDEKGREAVPKWVVLCNFVEFHIYDMDHPQNDPTEIKLEELPEQYYLLNFLVRKKDISLQKEMEISIQAGEIVGQLYDALLKEYKDPSNEHSLKSLNELCVRLVFCLYAEDAGIFGRRLMFHDYMQQNGPGKARQALIDLFHVLDTPEENRDPYMDDDLAAFPYVNGGLFKNESIEIPRLNETIYDLLLNKASAAFDWSEISPTIFGAVFESTLNPETRRKGGMHYTSIENIHKVIDPLFLDDLQAELEEIKQIPNTGGTRTKKMQAFQAKLASLKFFDPACGSGNFLTETYLSIRRLENEVIRYLKKQAEGQIAFAFMTNDSIGVKVSIKQFYGIEINDFSVSVAKTALWIAEAQMLCQTKNSTDIDDQFLPLTTIANIHKGNALRIDWHDIVPAGELNYIMGNPPFGGFKMQSDAQREDMTALCKRKIQQYGLLDYVCGWYIKSAEYIQNTNIHCAFVSTNSITQGEQPAILWEYLYNLHIDIDFAYKTFIWENESSIVASVHCVIIGFSISGNNTQKALYSGTQRVLIDNISPYLISGESILVKSRKHPLCNVPPMIAGNKTVKCLALIMSQEEKDDLVQREPMAEQYIKRMIGAEEFINSIPRYCLWLVGVSPVILMKMPLVMERVERVRHDRLNSKDKQAHALANTPTTFRDTNNPEHALVVPLVSSERRKYIPIGYIDNTTIANNKVSIIPNGTLYQFGVLTSNVHNAWMRCVAMRMKSDYSYSLSIVYNTFPWPNPTDAQKQRIEETAQAILDARAKYPECSLAVMYGDKMYMFPELLTAHQQNDRAVWEAYGKAWSIGKENDCVAYLMRLYQTLTAAKGGKK